MERKKLTLEEINGMDWIFPSNKTMAIDYHLNGNQYAEYDHYTKVWGKSADVLSLLAASGINMRVDA